MEIKYQKQISKLHIKMQKYFYHEEREGHEEKKKRKKKNGTTDLHGLFLKKSVWEVK